MTGIAIPADPTAIAAYEDALRAAARDFADNAVSDNTERAYEAVWRSFTAFTAALGRNALRAEPQTVADYVATSPSKAARRRRSVRTSRRSPCAIAKSFDDAMLCDDLNHPCSRTDFFSNFSQIFYYLPLASRFKNLFLIVGQLIDAPLRLRWSSW